MITAVDSTVFLDLLTGDATYGPSSREALASCRSEGALIACEVVWAEVATGYDDPAAAADALDRLGVRFDPLDAAAALEAGAAWRRRRRHGHARGRIVADFLIGAHAVTGADRLLSRDRGFFRSSFGGLDVLDPSQTG